MPRNKNKSPYQLYMVEFRKSEEAKGVVFPNGMKDVAAAASATWNAMPESLKSKYKEKARGAAGLGEKYNSMGVSMTVIQNQIREAAMAAELEEKTITDTIRDSHQAGTLVDKRFYLIDTNFYCQLNNKTYITCEVGCIAFSLKNGIEDMLHTLLDPGEIPTGFDREAMENSREMGIPLPPHETAQADFVMVLSQLISMMGTSRPLPPVYTMPASVERVRSFLDQICVAADEDTNIFSVYSLPMLFLHLKYNLTAGNVTKTFPTVNLAEYSLNAELFTYNKGLACEMHDACEKFFRCCQSSITCWVYVVCDHCCKNAGIPLIPGKHVFIKSNVDGNATSSSDTSIHNLTPTASTIPESLVADVSDTIQRPKIGNSSPSETRASALSHTFQWGKPRPTSTQINASGEAISPPVQQRANQEAPEISPETLNEYAWPTLDSTGRGRGRLQ